MEWKPNILVQRRIALAGGPRGPAGGGGAEGEALAFRAFVRLGQAKLNEEAFRWLVAHAEDWGLPGPMDLMDQDKPVGPTFLAYLRDRKPESATRFHR